MFEIIIPESAEHDADMVIDEAFKKLGWPVETITEMILLIESIAKGRTDSESVTTLDNEGPDMTGWTMKDVAEAALYGNIDFHVPGYDRPIKNEAVDDATEATLKFIEYLKKYKPIGYTHYDMVDLSQDFKKLFDNKDDSNFHDDE